MSVLGRVAGEAIDSADGYAARDVLGFRELFDGITERQHRDLGRVAAKSGLGTGTIPEPIVECLTAAASEAITALDLALSAAT
jgi:hypothetical protein